MEEILRQYLPCDEETMQAFLRYGARLMETNAVTNLTAIRDERGIAHLHFLDSAALLPMADFAGRRVADVGTGAGFPGLPLKLLQKDIDLTLIDANNKKIDFLQKLCAELGVDCRCLWARVEEQPQLKESFDIVVSRSVAELDILAELCLPLVKTGGLFLAMKKPDCGQEVSRAEFAIKTLGGSVREIRRYTVPDTDVQHAVVVVDKRRASPPQYPRPYAKMKKKPLGGNVL